MPVTSTGFDEVITGMLTIATKFQAQVQSDRDAISRPVVAGAAIYPAELPNQRYVRTYDLQRGWTQSPAVVTTSGPDVTIQHTNPVEYVADVQEAGKQDIFFSGRWDTLDHVAAKAELATADAVTQSVIRVLERTL